MSDLGNLSGCIMDNDAGALERARRLRRKALLGSLSIEAALIAAMLLWPYVTPGVLPQMALVTPLPPYRNTTQTPHVAEPTRNDDFPRPAVGDSLPVPTQRHPSEMADANAGPPAIGVGIDIGPQPGIPGGSNTGAPINIPRPDSTPAPRGPLKVSSGVMEARLVHRVQPIYPIAARTLHFSGVVELRAIIGTDGRVREIEVVSGNPILAQAARDAVAQWRYEPTRLGGQPVEVETDITVTFVMQ